MATQSWRTARSSLLAASGVLAIRIGSFFSVAPPVACDSHHAILYHSELRLSLRGTLGIWPRVKLGYVLGCIKCERIYVGVAVDREARIRCHQRGYGSSWTKRTDECYHEWHEMAHESTPQEADEAGMSWEKYETLLLSRKYGDKVRGYAWTSNPPSQS
jgi:predicted GIY-YIG superfamily endonuclease